jgi:hypothetical protein
MSLNSPVKTSSYSVVKRLAEKSDLNDLVNICKKCFPDEVLWNVKSLSRKYWDIALNSDSIEIWIWQINGRIASFGTVVVDLVRWKTEKIYHHQYSWITKLTALISNPYLTYSKIKKKIWMIKYKINKKKQNNNRLIENPENVSQISHKESADNSLISYSGVYCNPETLVWGELAAILPEFRSFGLLALQMIKFGEDRALALGKKEYYSVVHASKPWFALLDRLGYKRLYEENARFTIRKELS